MEVLRFMIVVVVVLLLLFLVVGLAKMMPATLRRIAVRMKKRKRARARMLPALASAAQLAALATTPPQLLVHLLLIRWF